jgi:hypothetical protein
MAIAFSGTASESQLEVTFQDVYGQKATKRYPIGPAVTDADILAIVGDLDLTSNAQLISVGVLTKRGITGQKGAPINALERKISDVLELTFIGTNSNAKPVARSVGIPALKSSTVLLDGSPDTTNTNLADLIAKLATDLAYVQASGAVSVGTLTYAPSESHQISLADVVETP